MKCSSRHHRNSVVSAIITRQPRDPKLHRKFRIHVGTTTVRVCVGFGMVVSNKVVIFSVTRRLANYFKYHKFIKEARIKRNRVNKMPFTFGTHFHFHSHVHSFVST